MGKRGRKVQRTISLENLTILHNFNNMAQGTATCRELQGLFDGYKNYG